mmetsp:Transcript_10691/g.30135  ORF Transcript_10691/g.30135 Transcript_10691/m.30135 type:complete len:215 (+) Transcript_10691:546-1190(+)
MPRRCKLFARGVPDMMSRVSSSMIPLHLDMFKCISLGQHSTMTSSTRFVSSQHPETSRYVRLAPQHLRMGSRDFSVTWTQDGRDMDETLDKALSLPSSTRSSWSATECASLFRCSALQTSALLTNFPHLLHTRERDIMEVGQLSDCWRTSVKILRSWSSSRSFKPGTVVVTDSAKSTYCICWARAVLDPENEHICRLNFLALSSSVLFCWLRFL